MAENLPDLSPLLRVVPAGLPGDNGAMSYFTAVLAQTDDGYKPLDLDVSDSDSLDELVDALESAGEGDHDAVAVIEHEDQWFGIVRLLAGGEVKVFISDVDAAADSPYADLFADYLDAPPDDYDDDPLTLEDDYSDGDVTDDEPDDNDDDSLSSSMLDLDDDAEWGGDPDIFADAGVPSEELIDQVKTYPSDPARVVAHVGEKAGFAEQLEAAR